MTLNPRSGINVRIFAGLGAIILLLVIILISAYIALDETRKSERTMLEENFGNLYDLPTLRANINGQRLAIALMLEIPRKEWGPWLEEIERRRRAADSIINNLIFRFRSVRKESQRLGAFIEVRDTYQRTQDRQIDLLINAGNIEQARALFLGEQTDNYSRMRSVMSDLEQMELAEARAMVTRTEESAESRMRAFLVMGVMGALIAAVLAAYMNRTVLSYVREVRSAEGASCLANRALKMLNRCNAIVIRATDETRLLEDICRTIVDLGGHKMAWVGYADDDKNKSVRPMAFAGEDGEYIDHAKISWGDNERGRGPTGTCIRSGEIVIARDTSTEPGYEPWRYRAVEKGFRSSLTLPLKDGERVYGALMVYSATVNAFDEEEVELLKELADDLAFATAALREQSARLQAERSSRESASYARSLLEASLDPLLAVNPSGKITDVNVATEETTGKCRKELIGTDFAVCFTDPERTRAGHREALLKGFVRDYPLTIRHASGRLIDVLYNASVYRNENGDLQGIFVVAREIRQKG